MALSRFISLFSGTEPEHPTLQASDVTSGLRDKALQQALQLAAAQKRPATLSDYFLEAAQLQKEADQLGIAWTPKEIGNFSGMKLDGFTIRRVDLNPTDYLKPVEGVSAAERQQAHHAVENMRAALGNMYDLDQNGRIEVPEVDAFYQSLSENLNFNQACFLNVTFQPATTLHILDKAEGAQYGNVTLDTLQEGETLRLGNTRDDVFRSVNLINAQGGTVEVGGVVQKLSLNGADVTLAIQPQGQVNDLKVTAAENLRLEVAPGGRMTRIDCEGAIIDRSSKLAGSDWHGGSISNSDLSGVQLTHATLNSMNIHAPNLEGASFAGTHFRNVQFSGIHGAEAFANLREALRDAGSMQHMLVNGFAVNALQDLDGIEAKDAQQSELAALGSVLRKAISGVATLAPAQQTLQLASGISGGETAHEIAAPRRPQTEEERYAAAAAAAAKYEEPSIFRERAQA